MAKVDVYDLGNYLPYYPDLGIYDFNDKDIELFNRLKSLPFQKKVVITNELLDSVSHKVYGTEKLWWVIAIYNDIIDPLEIKPLEISVPSLSDIESILIDLVEKLKKKNKVNSS